MKDKTLGRMTGFSTGQALKALGEAMCSPETRIYFKDHHGTRDANIHLLEKAMRIAGELKLRSFLFNKVTLSVRYSLERLK